MEYLSISQIAAKLNISDNAVRIYIKRFKKYFTDTEVKNKEIKHNPKSVDIIRKIHTCYNEQAVDQDSIKKILDGKYCTTQRTDMTKNMLDNFQKMTDLTVNFVWETFNSLVFFPMLGLTPEIKNKEDRDTEHENSDSTIDTPDSTATDTMSDKQEQGLEKDIIPEKSPSPSLQKKIYDKDEICKIIVALRDSKNLTWSEIAQELKVMGYSPQNKDKETFHHLVVSNFYKYAKRDVPSEPAHKSVTIDKQVTGVVEIPKADDAGSSTPFTDQEQQPTDGTDTSETWAAPPEWHDKEAYRKYTLNLIIELKNADMTLKEIVDKLRDMGVKTRTGIDKWSIGTISNILKSAK